MTRKTKKAPAPEFNVKTAPDWFFQSCPIKDADGQYIVMYFTTEEASDVLITVHTQHRLTGARETVPVKQFFDRFQPILDEEELIVIPRKPKREAERLELT